MYSYLGGTLHTEMKVSLADPMIVRIYSCQKFFVFRPAVKKNKNT